MLRGRIEALEHREWPSRAAARCVDRHLDGLVQTADAVSGLSAGGKPVGPLLRRSLGQFLERDAIAFGGIGLDPGEKVGRREAGERQQHVGEVPLGIDDERGDAVDRSLLDEVDEQARLAAACHAHADGVGGDSPGVDQERRAGG